MANNIPEITRKNGDGEKIRSQEKTTAANAPVSRFERPRG